MQSQNLESLLNLQEDPSSDVLRHNTAVVFVQVLLQVGVLAVFEYQVEVASRLFEV